MNDNKCGYVRTIVFLCSESQCYIESYASCLNTQRWPKFDHCKNNDNRLDDNLFRDLNRMRIENDNRLDDDLFLDLDRMRIESETKQEQIRWNSDISNAICLLERFRNSAEPKIYELQQQNQDQAEIIAIQTNSLNLQAIEIVVLKSQIAELLESVSDLKHILCSRIDCNAQVIGEVEPVTDGLNQML